MAIVVTIKCDICGETKRVARSNSDHDMTCWECRKKEADQKRREFLAGRAGLTVEERLALIEQWIYDYRPPVDHRTIVYG